MERHLEHCPRCSNACDSLRKTLALCHVRGADGEVPLRVQRAVKVAIAGFLQGSEPR
jgi:RNA polymerase sigma-70 factor (ECF subfamily)